MSCVVVCDIVRFDLRAFLGFLAGFYLFTLQLIHFGKIRGLERLKMRFLLKLRACAGVYNKYLFNKCNNLISKLV